MSTNKNPVHMRLWTFAWRYSRERRQGLSRIAALRAAWAWVNAKWDLSGLSLGSLVGTAVAAPASVNADLIEQRKLTIADIARAFGVPLHMLQEDAEPAPRLDFDAMMRQRTEQAHREFMERTSRRLPCDVSTREVAAYMRGSRA
jgi:hypothetical protein